MSKKKQQVMRQEFLNNLAAHILADSLPDNTALKNKTGQEIKKCKTGKMFFDTSKKREDKI